MNKTDKIPFLDLSTLHAEFEEELVSVFTDALRTGGFVGGPAVEKFEQDFAAFCDARHCVGVASGTDALRFALMAAGIGDGDIVITVPNSFIATTEAISQAGARPVFVDIDDGTYNMHPRELEAYLEGNCYRDEKSGYWRDRKLGRRVAAVIPVHLYGQPADMDVIQEIADRFHLTVIEDACQAHGAEYFSSTDDRWKKAGSMGKAAAFSFYPGKNLGACGEAGAVTTNDALVAQKIRMLRDHGQAKKYFHDVEGYNGRLDAIQAGILEIKLKRLPSWNQARRAAAQRYAELLDNANLGWLAGYEPEWSRSVYHLYVIRVQNRERLMKQLADANIGTGIHYPVPLHLQKAYKYLGYKAGDFPIAEAMASELVSLPMYPQLVAEQQERVVNAIQRFALESVMTTPARKTRYAAAGD
ncbi:MAG: DegT/DnrJ/EryC1/StrS family aminotransferase [Bryobacteraceae bacterium]|jgi:dTDP-4-amino-4,6-dideoxygalactose transaminase